MEASFFQTSVLCILTTFLLTPISVYAQKFGEIKSVPTHTNSRAQHNLGTDVQRNDDLIVRNITFKFEPNGEERVYFNLNRRALPALSSIEGQKPRVIADFKNVAAIEKGLTTIKVNGKMIRRIRTWLNKSTRDLRVVLDLEPGVDYRVNEVFIEAEMIYVLGVQEY
jgi:hypothetical protein